MKKVVKIIDFTAGRVASSRQTAVNIINKKYINFNSDKIIFDFENIEVASHSFVDELIGPYIQEIGKIPKNIKFQNCNNYVKEQIRFVVDDRINNPIFV